MKDPELTGSFLFSPVVPGDKVLLGPFFFSGKLISQIPDFIVGIFERSLLTGQHLSDKGREGIRLKRFGIS